MFGVSKESIEEIVADTDLTEDEVIEIFNLYNDCGEHFKTIAAMMEKDEEVVHWVLESEGLDPNNGYDL